jgi:RNase H-fold protein (predicted Holliday junction resolvase)
VDSKNLVSVQYKWLVNTQKRQLVVVAGPLSMEEATASEAPSSRTLVDQMLETLSGIIIWEATAVPISRGVVETTRRVAVVGTGRR